MIQSWRHYHYFVFVSVCAYLPDCLEEGLNTVLCFLIRLDIKWKWILLLCSKSETPAPSFSSGSWIICCGIICTEFKTSINQQEHVTCNKHSFHQQSCDTAVNLSLRCSTLVFRNALLLCKLLINPTLFFRSLNYQCIHIIRAINIFSRCFRKWNDWTGILQKREL